VTLGKAKVLLDDFSSGAIKNDFSTLELAKKINVVVDTDLPPNDISHSNMAVRMLNGETFSYKVDTLRGSPLKPMSFDECAAKFIA